MAVISSIYCQYGLILTVYGRVVCLHVHICVQTGEIATVSMCLLSAVIRDHTRHQRLPCDCLQSPHIYCRCPPISTQYPLPCSSSLLIGARPRKGSSRFHLTSPDGQISLGKWKNHSSSICLVDKREINNYCRLPGTN